MEFQGARNLAALDRALQTLEETLLHLGDCEDCLNREVILPVSASDEVGQALEVARVSLLRIQTTLHQHKQVADARLRAAQVAFLMERPLRNTANTDLSCSSTDADVQPQSDASLDTQKVLPVDGHSYAGTAVRGGLGGLHDE